MTLAYKGSFALGALCPTVLAGTASAAAKLTADLSGAVALQASLAITPPTIADTIANLNAFIANLTNAATLGLPNVSFNLSAAATLIGQLQTAIGVLVALQTALAAGGVLAYVYTGPGNGLGSALATALAGGWPDGTVPAANVTALILAATTAPALVGMTGLFGGVLP